MAHTFINYFPRLTRVTMCFIFYERGGLLFTRLTWHEKGNKFLLTEESTREAARIGAPRATNFPRETMLNGITTNIPGES